MCPKILKRTKGPSLPCKYLWRVIKGPNMSSYRMSLSNSPEGRMSFEFLIFKREALPHLQRKREKLRTCCLANIDNREWILKNRSCCIEHVRKCCPCLSFCVEWREELCLELSTSRFSSWDMINLGTPSFFFGGGKVTD